MIIILYNWHGVSMNIFVIIEILKLFQQLCFFMRFRNKKYLPQQFKQKIKISKS